MRHSTPQHAPRQHGFTLVEMVMVMVIIGVIGFSLASLISAGLRSYTAGRGAVDTLSSLRLSSERIARELRTVRRNPVLLTDFNFLSAVTTPTTSVDFNRLENDGSTVTRVIINTSGSNIRISYDGGSNYYTLTNQLGTFTLSYLQQNGIAATSNANVAFVDIDLSLTDSNGNSYPQRTRVALRNRL